MKYKEQIIGIVVLCVVAGGIFAAWQFHFKEVFAQYRTDDALRETLERALTQLEQSFNGYEPEVLIQEWQGKLQPWRNAREERAGFFSFGDWFDVEVNPDQTRMLKFWYTEELNRMTGDLYRIVFEKMGGYDRFPQDIRAVFNIQLEEDFGGGDITMREVRTNLEYMSFATSLTQFLMDANITRVESITPWPRRFPGMFQELLGLQTVGLRFQITARDLALLLDELRQQQRYFSVEAMRVTYPYIGYPTEPQLNVSMLLTQANYRKPADEAESPRGGGGGPGGPGQIARPPVATTAQPGAFARAWVWFKRNVLYMN